MYEWDRTRLSDGASYGPAAPASDYRITRSIYRTSDGETRVLGKNVTMCHHKCQSDNVRIGTEYWDTETVIKA
jgi:hypothetical protein